MSLGYWETLCSQYTDGPTLTAGTRALATHASGQYVMAANRLKVGDVLSLRAFGRISMAATAGSCSWDLSTSAAGGVKIFDTLPIPGNATAQTTVPWWLEAEGIVRAVGSGTSTNMFWGGLIASTAFINVAAVATGPYAGVVSVPFNVAPVVGTGFDSTVANTLSFNFTQTLATATQICHNFTLSLKSSSGF